ncbi:hypothetical protein QBC36DRAFT_319999 [Triangularia setosa]|uniref:Uncharacterized protein n=1 Tax=Triangularia setosa TaxID=2587417 RepID=A0AAN6WEP7_9PEZI|nr:hypothetical protein QBC36DRAFT_319999 [Podospora setosa]
MAEDSHPRQEERLVIHAVASESTQVKPKPIWYYEGGFSQVSFYNPHRDQQNLKRYTKEGVERQIAVKRLKSGSREDFEKEYLMFVKLTPSPSPHLAKLLAAYEIPGGASSSSRPQYCLMFERPIAT